MRRRRVRGLGRAATIACALIVTAAAGRAMAGDTTSEATAADRFAEGEKAFQRGDFTRAGEAFEAAYAAKPHESALWNAARSWERGGEPARAANLYRRYLRTAPDDAPDRKRATAALDALTPKLGRVEIVAPDLSSITVDGTPIELPTVFVLPGSHLVEARSAAGVVVHSTVVLTAGSVESIVLSAPSPAPVVGPSSSSATSSSPAPLARSPAASSAAPRESGPPASPDPARHRGASPWLLAPFVGLTVVSSAVLIGSGIDTLKAKSDYDELKTGRTAKEQQQLIDDGVYKTDRTNVVIGITAGLAVVTGVVALTAIDWKPAPKPAGPGRPPRASFRLRVGAGGGSVDANF